jgi:hypothetical protein
LGVLHIAGWMSRTRTSGVRVPFDTLRLWAACSCRDIARAARRGLEPRPPGSEPGVVPVPPPRIGLDGRNRTSNPRLPGPVRCQVAPRPGGTDGGIRTHTDGGLSAVPLPVGLRQLVVVSWTERDSKPAPDFLQGSCASVAPPAQALVAGPSAALGMVGVWAPPERWLSRVVGVTDRTRTGFLRDHNSADRPLLLRSQSTRRESNPHYLRVKGAVCR